MSLGLRHALGRFCTGVVVVSVATENDVHAMTANAFTSVSLEPPLVLVSIGCRTRMHAILPESESFGISVLGSHQEHLAKHFAGQSSEVTDFAYEDGVPLVRDAIAYFVCRREAAHAAGDHTLFVGLVSNYRAHDGEPLVFHSGSFGSVEGHGRLAARGAL